MGTWGSGPFDGDMATDFVDGLAGMPSEQVIPLPLGQGSSTPRPLRRNTEGPCAAQATAHWLADLDAGLPLTHHEGPGKTRLKCSVTQT
ncbi:DUF4259 domain-containing protein [Streptomyces subrutilus]|uniref:DUF4259 domain-containing protein n=1 Tax=Streptomyces subrutilus TaxID=36818 RepID=UPI0033EFEC60